MQRMGLVAATMFLGCDNTTKNIDTGLDTSVETIDADQDGFPEGEDCDDSNASINPGATEVCNGSDDDCDGLTDDEDDSLDPATATTYYDDADGDSYGDADGAQSACVQPDGYVTNGDDCADSEPAVNPDATEVCNGSDDDCDGLTDDEDDSLDPATATTYYADADGDGYGLSGDVIQACMAPSGYVLDSTDCNDGLSSVNPAALETCNGIDDDCDPMTSEDNTIDVSGAGYATLGSALSAAVSGDTVTICDGTYIGSFFIPDGLTVTSYNGPDSTIIAGDGSGKAATFILEGEATLLDLTFRDGFSLLGGAIDGYSGKTGGDIEIYNCVFENNTAGFGGAILSNLTHTLTVVDSTFTDNTAFISDGTNNYGSGGSVYAMDLDVQASTFDSNEALFGGALYVEGNATFDADTSIINNIAYSISDTEDGYGGSFYCNNGSMSFNATLISSNTADSFGGGGFAISCDLYGGSYSGNIAGLTGGGVYMLSSGAHELTDAAFSNNEASYAGGVMFDGSQGAGTITADGLTIESNYADSLGGGVWALGVSLAFTGSTLSGNEAVEAGGGIYVGSEDGSGESKLNCDAVNVTGNLSDRGAGYYLEGSSLRLVGGVITDNTASTDGGGAYLQRSTLSSDASDWSGTSSDNSPDDIYIEDADVAYDSYGTGESFDCDTSSCE